MRVIPKEDQAHLDQVAVRVEEMKAKIADRTKVLAERVDLASIQRLAEQAQRAGTSATRVHWLRQMTAVAETGVGPVSACRAGCSHCCHIAVTISHAEAQAISKEIGMPLLTPSNPQTLMDMVQQGKAGADQTANRFVGVPCTFLRDDKCSIYASRPMACRMQFNLDQDDLLCQLVEGQAIPVPYFDSTRLKAVAIQVFGVNSGYADIREWFGAPRESSAPLASQDQHQENGKESQRHFQVPSEG